MPEQYFLRIPSSSDKKAKKRNKYFKLIVPQEEKGGDA
jgi:hypothetical protein